MGRRRRRTPVIYTSGCHPRPVDLPRWRGDDGHGISRTGRRGGTFAGRTPPSSSSGQDPGWSRQWASGRLCPRAGSSHDGGVSWPRFLPEVVAVSSLSTSRHLLVSLGIREAGQDLRGETGQGGVVRMQRHTSLSTLSGEHLVDLRTHILTWRGPAEEATRGTSAHFLLGDRLGLFAASCFALTCTMHTHISTPWPLSVSKMEFEAGEWWRVWRSCPLPRNLVLLCPLLPRCQATVRDPRSGDAPPKRHCCRPRG